MKTPSLSHLLKRRKFPSLKHDLADDKQLQELQLRLLRIQQGLWHQKKRVVIAFEGFDAAGKGGAIHRLVEPLDPRGVKVHPIGPPSAKEQGKHYLHRFWKDLPEPGSIAVFDRSWYGRVLVEKIEGLTSSSRVHQAYDEILQTEEMWIADGIEVIKIFLAIDKDEQWRRFQERLANPYKQWKLTFDDVKARKRWPDYVAAVDKMFSKTHRAWTPWHLIPANDKHYARKEVLKLVITRLHKYEKWMESAARKHEVMDLKKALAQLRQR